MSAEGVDQNIDLTLKSFYCEANEQQSYYLSQVFLPHTGALSYTCRGQFISHAGSIFLYLQYVCLSMFKRRFFSCEQRLDPEQRKQTLSGRGEKVLISSWP